MARSPFSPALGRPGRTTHNVAILPPRLSRMVIPYSGGGGWPGRCLPHPAGGDRLTPMVAAYLCSDVSPENPLCATFPVFTAPLSGGGLLEGNGYTAPPPPKKQCTYVCLIPRISLFII